jgi:hypothetical protein
MGKYNVDLSAWLIVEAESEDEAFAIGHKAIDELRTLAERGGKITFDGEVAGVEDWED